MQAIRKTNVVLFLLSNSIQIPSVAAFTTMYVCSFLNGFFGQLLDWERNVNFTIYLGVALSGIVYYFDTNMFQMWSDESRLFLSWLTHYPIHNIIHTYTHFQRGLANMCYYGINKCIYTNGTHVDILFIY